MTGANRSGETCYHSKNTIAPAPARQYPIRMKVSAQYAQEHLAELLETAERGGEIEIAREGKPTARLIIMPAPADVSLPPAGMRIFGAGRGELVLPTDEEWKAMDKELEDIMTNGPLFPEEK